MSEQMFAKVVDGVVTKVCVVTKEFMNENPQRYEGTWIETFNNKEGHQRAAIGLLWDGKNFIVPALPTA
jgi:hypothetical protein